MAYDWLSLNRLGNTGSRGRSKNNLRGILMGIRPIWGLPLLPLDPLLPLVEKKLTENFFPITEDNNFTERN